MKIHQYIGPFHVGYVILLFPCAIVGRKSIFIATAALIIIGSLGSACAVDTPMLTIYGQGKNMLSNAV